MAIELKPTYQVKPIGPAKPKLNLFNFETKAPVSQIKPIVQKPSIIPQASANEGNVIQSFLDDSKTRPELSTKRNAVIQMLQNQEDDSFIEDAIVNKMQWSPVKPEQSFIGGVVEKTKDSFVGGIKRIGEAGVGIAEGKYTPAEGAVRGGAGALQSFFSPVSGVLGQTLQTGIEAIPEDIRARIKTEAKPTIEGVTSWYQNQSPEQRRRLDNIGVGVELLSNFIGAGAVQKATPIIKQTGKNVLEGTVNLGEGIVKKSDDIGKILEQKGQTFRDTVAGLQENEIKALKETPRAEFEGMLEQAKKAVGDDYAQTPYHEGAKKANDAFTQLEGNLEANQVRRIEEIKNSGVTQINTSSVREDIVKDIEKTFNIKGVDIKDGKIKYKTTAGREALLDEANIKDLEALKLLERVSKSKTPLEMMDTIKKMQNLIYDSNILNRTSKDMYNLVKRSIGKLNQTFKEQVGENYAKILDEMSGDIKLKNDLDKVFKASLGEVGNRGELAMKRLAKGTTTSSDVRNLALKIKERTGIDLIKEARLRQLVMDLAGDTRGNTLFGAIEGGKRGIIQYGLGKIRDLSPLSKEKTAIARTKKILPNATKNATTSNIDNSIINTSNKYSNTKNTTMGTDLFGNNSNKLLKAPTTTKQVSETKVIKKPSILAKEQVKQAVSKLTKENISEVAETIAKNYPGKLEQIKTVIKEFIKKHGDKYIDKLSELVDEIATKVGSKLNLIDDKVGIGIDKTRVISKGDDLIKEARKYKSADEFIKAQPKLYRGQSNGNTELKLNVEGNKNSTFGDAYFFTTDKSLAESYGKVQEIPFIKKDVLTKKEVERITKEAQTKLDDLVSKRIYEGAEYEKYEELAIGKYPDIAKHLNKPFIKTGNYNDTEILYFPEYDTTKTQLKQIYNKAKKSK